MARFLLDVMLGKLASYLRMCGHDAAYARDRGVEEDDALLAWAETEDRTLVTRDRQLATRAADALLVESRDVVDQLRELAAAGVTLELGVPRRCANCNAALVRVSEGEDTPDYAPGTDERSVWRCPGCGQYFWRGSHWDDVAETLARV